MKESIIQKAVLEYLGWQSNTHRIYWFRAGSGAVKTEEGRYFKTGKAGCPDIVVCMRTKSGLGVFVGLEIKNEKGRQSDVQKTAQAQIEAAGGYYFIIRSIDDVKKALASVV